MGNKKKNEKERKHNEPEKPCTVSRKEVQKKINQREKRAKNEKLTSDRTLKINYFHQLFVSGFLDHSCNNIEMNFLETPVITKECEFHR